MPLAAYQRGVAYYYILATGWICKRKQIPPLETSRKSLMRSNRAVGSGLLFCPLASLGKCQAPTPPKPKSFSPLGTRSAPLQELKYPLQCQNVAAWFTTRVLSGQQCGEHHHPPLMALSTGHPLCPLLIITTRGSFFFIMVGSCMICIANANYARPTGPR